MRNASRRRRAVPMEEGVDDNIIGDGVIIIAAHNVVISVKTLMFKSLKV